MEENQYIYYCKTDALVKPLTPILTCIYYIHL